MLDTIADIAADPVSGIGTALGSSGVMAAVGWFFLRSKLDSIKTIWTRIDDIEEKIAKAKEEAMEKLAKAKEDAANVRLADAKEYATRSEVREAVEKMERHFDIRLNSFEVKLDQALALFQKRPI